MISIELPFPAKPLWPNGRAHWSVKSRETKKHKEWACIAALAAGWSRPLDYTVSAARGGVSITLKVTINPKTRHPIDDDNARASLKAYQDGIALAMGVDDRFFKAVSLTFGEPIKGGLVRIELDAT